MRKLTALTAGVCVLTGSILYAADPAPPVQTASAVTSPSVSEPVSAAPGRPLAMTASQFQALQRFESAPEHQAVRDVRATYASEQERRAEANVIANDISTAATQAGWPTALAILLLVAAPL